MGGLITVAVLLVVFNIIMWIVFLSKFKKLFSTDDIIQSARNDLENLISDMNRNADRDVTLVEAKTRQLKEVIEEADQRIASIARQRSGLSEENSRRIQFQIENGDSTQESAGEKPSSRKKTSSTRKKASSAKSSAEKDLQSQDTRENAENTDAYQLEQDAAGQGFPDFTEEELAAEIQEPQRRRSSRNPRRTVSRVQKVETPIEAYLHSQEKTNLIQNALKLEVVRDGEENEAVDEEKPAGEEPPAVIPAITRSRTQVEPKVSFRKRVKELAEQGMTEAEIASIVGRSTQEVKLTLEIL